MTGCANQGGFPGRRNGRRAAGREWGIKGDRSLAGATPRGGRAGERGGEGGFFGWRDAGGGCRAGEPGHGERNARGWRAAGGQVQDERGRGAAERRARHGENLTTDDARDGAPRGAGRGKARARGVPQRGWGSDTPYCTRSDYSVPVGVGPGGGAWAGVCRALGCVNSVRPMCPVFRAMCQLWRGMCPLLRGICPVFRAMCSLSRPMCSVFRAMCSPSRQMCSVFPVMCSVFGVMCSVSADARPGGLVACGGRGFLAGFERTGRLSDECEPARDAWWLGPTGGSGPIHHERGAGRLLPGPLPAARPIHAGLRSLLRHLHP